MTTYVHITEDSGLNARISKKKKLCQWYTWSKNVARSPLQCHTPPLQLQRSFFQGMFYDIQLMDFFFIYLLLKLQ